MKTGISTVYLQILCSNFPYSAYRESATSSASPSLYKLAARPSWFRLLTKHHCGLRTPDARQAVALLRHPAKKEKTPFGVFSTNSLGAVVEDVRTIFERKNDTAIYIPDLRPVELV